MTPATITPQLIGELRQLSDAQIFWVLGELLEPSVGGPFAEMGEDLYEALEPIVMAYQAAYRRIDAIVNDDDHLWNIGITSAEGRRNHAASLAAIGERALDDRRAA